jgi:dipeptidyl aminopeptidase/acylaminoacyl peptidase
MTRKPDAMSDTFGVVRLATFALAVAWTEIVAAQPVTRADYDAASAVLEVNLRGLVKNQTVAPQWSGNRGDFWYQRDEAQGVSYVWFDARKRTKTPLFDHAAMASALRRALGASVEPAPTPTALGVTEVVVSADRRQLSAIAAKKAVVCQLQPIDCSARDMAPFPPGLLPSPDGKRAALVRNYNLAIRDLATGQERQLTTDGERFHAYGSLTDQSLIAIPLRKSGAVLPPIGTTWSPDGRYLLTGRVDERSVRVNPFVEWVPSDGSIRPAYHDLRSAFTGDRERQRATLLVFDVTSGRSVPVTVPEPYGNGEGDSPLALSADPVGWSVSRGQVFLIVKTLGSKSAALLRIDLASGKSTVVLEESSEAKVETNAVEYNVPNVRVIGDGAEAIWYSARSGWGHLYRYDAQTGALRNQITTGEWAVIDLLAVDETRREAFLTGGGREPGRDPYYRHLYRASLDGGPVVLLTDADADHHFDPPNAPALKLLFRSVDPPPLIHPAAGLLLDTYSTVSEPPVTVLRSTRDGRVIAEIERADASALLATGWRPPSREKVKAADGTTDLYAVYYQPLRSLPGGKHPIIDAEYGGPQVIVAPTNFVRAYSAGNPNGESSLARFGFAMVTVDGRGTPYRSRAFRDAGYPEFTQVGIDDHIAVIKQLAARHPEIDLDRVGIYGVSWGGTFAAQAILSRPDFFKVASSASGVYDYSALYAGFEPFIGVPRYGDGSWFRGEPKEKPANFTPLDITAMAPNLKGHLLILLGDLDENVPPVQAFRLIDALTKANKPYDLVVLPGRAHAAASDPYAIRRVWDYFIERLLGERPVFDATVTIRPAGR